MSEGRKCEGPWYILRVAENSMWVKCRIGEGSGRESKGVTGMRWERQAPPGNSG